MRTLLPHGNNSIRLCARCNYGVRPDRDRVRHVPLRTMSLLLGGDRRENTRWHVTVPRLFGIFFCLRQLDLKELEALMPQVPSGVRSVQRIAVVILLTVAAVVQVAMAQTGQGLETSGRWFLYDGKPIYLVGFDRQELASDPQLDYVQVLDQYARYRINKVRIWIYNWWGGPALLAPWSYNPDIGKYDLDQWDAVYWERLKGFLAAAEARGIIVEISIFADYSYHADQWSDPTWRYAWNRDFNVNGAFSTNKNGGFFPEFYDPDYNERSSSGRTVHDYQQALVDKTLQEVGPFSNIYFEVANEFPGDSDPLGLINLVYPWQQYWANYIKERSPRPVNVHAQESSGPQTLGVQYFSDEPYIDALGFHFYTWDPSRISDLLNPIQNKGKVITNNETFDISNAPAVTSYDQFYNGETRFAWAMFTSGGYIGHADYGSGDTGMNGDYSRFMATDEWKEGAGRAGALRNIAESVKFWQLSPTDADNNEYDGLVTAGPSGPNWQVLCKPGSEYVVYFWGSTRGGGSDSAADWQLWILLARRTERQCYRKRLDLKRRHRNHLRTARTMGSRRRGRVAHQARSTSSDHDQ